MNDDHPSPAMPHLRSTWTSCRGAGWLPPFEAARLPRRAFGDAYCLGAAPPTAADILRAGG